MTVHGVAEYVLVRGRVCAENGAVRVAEGYGRFIPMAVRPPYVYDIVKEKVHVPEEHPEENQNGNLAKKFAELDILIPEEKTMSALIAENLPIMTGHSPCSTPSVRGRVDGKRDMQESSFSISGELSQILWIYLILFGYISSFRGVGQIRRSFLH